MHAQSSGLRAAVNARLEDISFRTGMIIAGIAVAVLSAAAATAGILLATVGSSGPARNAADLKTVNWPPPAVSTAPAPAASAPAPAPVHLAASPKKKTQPTKPAAAVAPQSPAAAAPPQPAASSTEPPSGPASGWPGDNNPGSDGSNGSNGNWFGGHRPRHGGGFFGANGHSAHF